jgi:rhamnose utilization protein RhaD (predicted bifunctional aldolase and dehydrogenase)/NAD(P)-dependent dehydrogenase (short-subunit alcohol dehydrogenase family)
MNSLWNDDDARALVERYAAADVGPDVALRTYSARLLGADSRLVLHGGGNTSVKGHARDLTGEQVAVLFIKGSGWDLARIEPAGHPAVRLEPLLRLRDLEVLSDEAMVGALRANLLDSNAPNPSVEALLHAFIPEAFIDHTHATAFLALADQPDAEARLAELYGSRVAVVPYVMPGFALAKLAADAWRPGLEGIALVKHGLFTFGADARQSYERMIDFVSLAEQAIPGRPRPRPSATRPDRGEVLPILRGALGGEPRWILDLRDEGPAAEIVADPRLSDWAGRGVATPDHVIRTKAKVLVAPPFAHGGQAWRDGVKAALRTFAGDYHAYFARHGAGLGKTMLDSLPRVVAIPDLGLVALGRTASEAATAGDIAEAWAQTLLAAEAVGRFEPVGEADTFAMEYWSLEQAKLGHRRARPLEGTVAVVTGAAGAIGAAIARAFAAEGAALALLDLDAAGLEIAAAGLPAGTISSICDVTDRDAVEASLDKVCARFGGFDVLVSNAGAASLGAMADLDETALRSSFDINFFAHQHLAQGATRRLRAQGLGGAMLFNVSKQALNPGPQFGAYGLAKSALLALVRQYALEEGASGIRVNAVNADRVRSGLLSPQTIAARAQARGLSEEAYMRGNLLGAEVTPEDVAQAFVFAARMQKTTGAIFTVDGGNVAAMPR